MPNIFSPTKQRNNTKKIYGFDIETYSRKNKFLMGSIYGDDLQETFWNKKAMINYFKKPIFKNSYITATNLKFDFFGLFDNTMEELEFHPQFRASDLISTKSYLHDNKFNQLPQSKSDKTIFFIDTLNFAKMGVKAIGEYIGLPKLNTPKCLGKIPINKQEKTRLEEYNMRDSEISQKFNKKLFNDFEKLGGTPKTTIAQVSMSVFKNKYLKYTYFRHSVEDLKNQFKAYYGGRVECFKRGEIKNYNYYDFNSLYPSVMINEYPDPNTLRKNHQNNMYYIENYDGLAEVEVFCPRDVFPLLPLKIDHKLLFPTGTFRGWYSNVEIRKALQVGYIIKNIYQNYYFTENCTPFKEFVEDMYSLRQKQKAENSSMQLVTKLIMNSLYGKFGEKFENRDNWIPMPDSLEELHNYDFIERIGNYVRVQNNFSEPKAHCIPIWAIYTTAYGRIKLYDILTRCDPIYCDTDSIITRKEYRDKSGLGELKLECFIKKGIIIKPKMYGFIEEDGTPKVVMKGIGRKLDYKEFLGFLDNPEIEYTKFVGFKEAKRRNFSVNEIIDIRKVCSLEDNKRLWLEKFNPRVMEESTPYHFGNPSKIIPVKLHIPQYVESM